MCWKQFLDAPNRKGTEESRFPDKAVKSISEDAKDAIADAIIRFWHGEIDMEQLHEVVLIFLPKKEDLSQPNNWRPICLNDIFKKVISMIVTKRLLTIIKKHGIKNQFGSQLGRGCQDGLFKIQSLLELRWNHNLEMWKLFIDLKKAFGSANHQLLYALLARYGAPDSFIDIIC